MKKSLLYIIATLSFISCSNDPKVTPATPDINGKWELRYAGGGFSAGNTYLKGNGNIFIFKSDGTFKKYINGALKTEGTYQIKRQVSTNGMGRVDSIYFDHKQGDILQTNASTLSIGTSINDGIVSVYEKMPQ